MPRKPNYKFERMERDRAKAAKKAARQKAKAERRAAGDGSGDGTGEGTDASRTGDENSQ